MENAVLKALERSEKGKKSRQAGYIPGVIYAKHMDTASVKFDEKELLSLLKEKGQRVKVQLEYNGEQKLAIIKEIGRDVATSKIVHIDMQIVEEEHIIKRAIPVIYSGKGMLKSSGLYLQVYIPNVEVIGQVKNIPDVVEVNVSDKKPGDKVRIGDLNLGQGVKAMKSSNITLGSVSRL